MCANPFRSPSIPKPPPPPPPPAPEVYTEPEKDPQDLVRGDGASEEMRRRRGLASTNQTGGVTSPLSTFGKTLLGQ